ncbi:MAG: transglutaminase-like domain-containing protein [Fimbriimonas sp.]|nr:transglutaminase-like domain-containing protein [Fimbriimonas sp.]
MFAALAVAWIMGVRVASGDAYHVERDLAQRVKGVLAKTITVSDASSGFLKVLAFVPPNTETQRVVSYRVRCREFPNAETFDAGDKIAKDKSYTGVRVPLSSATLGTPMHFDVTYVVDLYKTALRSGPTGSGKKASQPSEFDSQASKTVDFESSAFKKFLDDHDLKRRPDESNAYFAYRAFHILSTDLAARVDTKAPGVDPSNWQASFLSQRSCRNGGCGFCSIQLVGILRANGIPARLLVGRWALNTEGDYGQFHVRTDFFDPSIGWIPVDPTFGMMAVQHGDNPDVNFGGTDGNFITFHLNSEVSPEGCNFYMPIHQFEVVAYDGTERCTPQITETWTVTKQ